MKGPLSGIAMIVRRSLRRHLLSTTVTVLAIGLATGLVMAVFAVSDQTEGAFTGGDLGFDAVVGARGSQLQLVLNSVFHLDTSPGNVPWALYEQLQSDPRVGLAIPYAVGDNYLGHRIVGTTPELFTAFSYRDGKTLAPGPGGRVFEPDLREAVIGSAVPQRTGLTLGATFQPTHGVVATGRERDEHEEDYLVVAVLEPTNSPADKVIWIPIDGMFHMSGHVLRGDGEEFHADEHEGEEIPDAVKQVSAIMLKLRGPQAGMALNQQYNLGGSDYTVAWPVAASLAQLFDKLGWVVSVLRLVAYLVVVVAAGTILASLYNTMNERRREFAILRALGARRRTVMVAIVLEAMAITALGCLAGLLVYGAIMAVAAHLVREQTGVVLDVFAWHPALAATPVGMLLLGGLAGLLPAAKAYATDVAAGLLPTS